MSMGREGPHRGDRRFRGGIRRVRRAMRFMTGSRRRFRRLQVSVLKIDPSSVIPAKVEIQNFPTELGLPSVWHGPSGFPPSRE